MSPDTLGGRRLSSIFPLLDCAHNSFPQPSQKQQKEDKSMLVAAVADSTPGKQGDAPGSSSSVRKGSPIQRAGGSGTDSAAAPSGGGNRGASGVSGLLLAMAMSMGGPGDGVLTREASTIEDYILLMSESQGLAATSEGVTDGENEMEGRSRTEASVWRQVMITLRVSPSFY